MSKSRQELFSIQDVLDVIDSGDNDFGQCGGSSDESDDDYIPVPMDNEEELLLLSDKTCDHQIDDDDDDSSDYSVDDVPFATRLAAPKKGKSRLWRKKHFEPPDDHFEGQTAEATDPTGITETPLQYFQRFVTQDMLTLIVEHSNRYSVHTHGSLEL